jgi:hypothetical protein
MAPPQGSCQPTRLRTPQIRKTRRTYFRFLEPRPYAQTTLFEASDVKCSCSGSALSATARWCRGTPFRRQQPVGVRDIKTQRGCHIRTMEIEIDCILGYRPASQAALKSPSLHCDFLHKTTSGSPLLALSKESQYHSRSYPSEHMRLRYLP